MARNRLQKGITLIETLVALVILGFVAGSTLTLISQHTRLLFDVEMRTFGAIIADNLMVETLLLPAVELGEDVGTRTLNGRAFTWQRTISESPVGGLVIVEIDISVAATSQTVASATTLRGISQ